MAKRNVLRSPRMQRALGVTLASMLQFVHRTSRIIHDPADFAERYLPVTPLIAAMWHGEHFLLPFCRPPAIPVKVMISRSADGELNAIAAERLGLGLIRASGGRTAAQVHKRHGVKGFLEALTALEEGTSVALTADVPKVARVAGPGIALLASRSGRPVVPIAAATSRRFHLNNWDRTTINLPFSRFALVYGKPIWIRPDLDERGLEEARTRIAGGLNTATERVYALVDGVVPWRSQAVWDEVAPQTAASGE